MPNIETLTPEGVMAPIGPYSHIAKAGGMIFISQHIGDLETAESMAAFERVIADFLRLYEAVPIAIAHDLHPDYLSTRWAQA